MSIKTCCVTGHRNVPTKKVEYVTVKLEQEIMRAIEGGYTRFISGFAAGTDLLFSEIIVELKDKYPIILEAAIPYSKRLKTPDKMFQKLIKYCNKIVIHCDAYSKDCYIKRNRYMVEQSELVIAVWDGRHTGGTAATISHAKRFNKNLRLIQI